MRSFVSAAALLIGAAAERLAVGQGDLGAPMPNFIRSASPKGHGWGGKRRKVKGWQRPGGSQNRKAQLRARGR